MFSAKIIYVAVTCKIRTVSPYLFYLLDYPREYLAVSRKVEVGGGVAGVVVVVVGGVNELQIHTR